MERVESLEQQREARAGRITQLLRAVDSRVIDAFLALVLTALGLASVIGRSGSAGIFRDDDSLGLALLLLQTLPLAARSVAPLGVLIVISLAVLAHSVLGYAQVQAGTFASLIALYGAASLTDSRRGAIAAVVSTVSVAGFFVTNRGEWTWPAIASTGATWAVAWIAGTFVRVRGDQLQVVGARASRLEIERDSRAREAVADERARMARELHDIVGHALNLIVIQASGAGRVIEARPEVAREALASIESTGREALSDMERMLGVLRAADSPHDETGPQPGLGQLDELAANVTEAGMPVQIVVEGAQLDVPASVELSAYRIVQEALTNCLKHSGASGATVTVRYRPRELEIEVVDNGRGSSTKQARTSEGGRGHLGMRERIAVFGGEISMGPLPSTDGYRVWALLPISAAPA